MVRQFTRNAYVLFSNHLHEFYLMHGRFPRFDELPTLYKSIWLRNDANTKGGRRKSWILGHQLELEIHRFLINSKVNVSYDPYLDVYFGVDLMVEFRPVQIKSTHNFRKFDGTFYLVVDDYNGYLTTVHRDMIMDFVQKLKT